jgi:RNA polymerase sigma factor (sigma-70 family)
MNAEPDEYELAVRAREGDPEALAALVARTRLRLFTLAYGELRNYEDAQDAVAAALLQVCLHVKDLRQPASVRAWMARIVRNEVHRLRRGAVEAPNSLEEAEPRATEPAPYWLRLDIERALRQLPGDQAGALRLFYLADLPVDEIARRLSRPEGTIKSWLHRGRQRLATEMEGYAPMARKPSSTPTPLQEAALIHTDLDPELVRQITEVLQAGGHRTTVIVPYDVSRLVDSLKVYPVILLDEWIAGRSALECLMHLKANPATFGIPICLLCADPSTFSITAYFAAGIERLVNKTNPEHLARLAQPFRKAGFTMWRQFTERARRMVYIGQEEAAGLGHDAVDSEHVLLGLLREPNSVAARLLAGPLGVPLQRIRDILQPELIRGTGAGDLAPEPQLTPRAKRIMDLADEEARRFCHNYIGSEHLLLGMIREDEGLAARVLATLGVELERVREAIQGYLTESR